MLMSFVNLISLPSMTTPLSSCHIIKRAIIHARLKCKSIKESCCDVSAIRNPRRSKCYIRCPESKKIQKSYSLSGNPKRSRSHIRCPEIREDPVVIFSVRKSDKIQKSYSLSRNHRRSRSHTRPESKKIQQLHSLTRNSIDPEVIFVV